jgi:hypothetical protein
LHHFTLARTLNAATAKVVPALSDGGLHHRTVEKTLLNLLVDELEVVLESQPTVVVGVRTRTKRSPPATGRRVGAAKRALSAEAALEDRARPSTTTLCAEEASLTD